MPYLANVDVRWGQFDLSDLREMPFEESEKERYGLRFGDIVMCEGGEPGRCAIWKDERPGMMFQKALFRIRPHKELLPEFLYYYFVDTGRRNAFSPFFTGSTIKHLPREKLSLVEVPLPPLSKQRRIAGILSAYDDLIENNRKRIALLEESARRLYKEWFGQAGRQGFGERQETRDEPIDARRETIDASLVSRLTSPRVSRLMSHAQFRVTTLGDICKTIGGGTPKTGVAEYWDGDIPWVVPTDITRNFSMALLDTERKITLAGLQNSSAKTLPARAILMTSRASVGYFGMADFPVCTNQGFISIIPNRDIWRWYLLFNLMSRVEEIRGKAKGSTFPEISKSNFRDMDIAIPSDDVLIGFNAFVEPVMKQVNTLARQSRTLATARDALLPRLMKGSIV